MFVIRSRTGELRLVWRLAIILVLSVAVAFLLRFIPIVLYTAYLAGAGTPQEEALASAKTIVFEGPAWTTALGILNGFMYFLLVWLLIRVIEKRSFAWKEIGMDWRRRSLAALAGGALLALSLHIASPLAGLAFGSSIPSVSILLAGLAVPGVLLQLAHYLAMGFGEEVVFRGYMQTRLVERLGAVWGILIASVVFCSAHLVFMSLSPVTILSAVMLWAAIGTLYHWTKSLYLVGMFHGMANTLTNTLPLADSPVGGLLVHALALVLVILAFRRSRASRVRANET